ncbi:hypothetical protein ERJ75_000855000 [Trypanosoma vivax]|nr:hypothetical protein ERJ75_000855000 [Trypanosoma vivax]
MEKSTALRFDTIVWNNVVGKNGTIDTYVKKVVDVLNGTQLQLMLQELDNATVPLADALKAMKGLRDETKMINNEVDSVKREAFCRATVFLAKLQKRRDELVHKLSDLAPHCAAEESLESPRSMVTRTNFAVVKAQRSVLESKEKTVSILTEAQKVMAESEHGANQRETTGKLVKIAEEAREDVRRADVFVNAAIGEARHAAVALVSANNVWAAVAKSSKLETALATIVKESVLNITLHLDAVGRVAPYNEVRSSPGAARINTTSHRTSLRHYRRALPTWMLFTAWIRLWICSLLSLKALRGWREVLKASAKMRKWPLSNCKKLYNTREKQPSMQSVLKKQLAVLMRGCRR